MKKVFLLMAVVFTSGIYFNTNGQTNSVNKSETAREGRESGEKILIEHADECLSLMEQAAQKMSVTGVAVIAFIPGDVTKTWISKMKVLGALCNDDANFLAIAYSKAAEMADTYNNSGGGLREPRHGEFGYQGGIVKKVDSGYILAVFSGASGDQDAELANKGLDCLYKFY